MFDDIRRQIRSKRSKLSKEFIRAASLKITNNFLENDLFQQSKNVAVYLSTDGEVETNLLIKHIWDMGKNCYLPIIDKDSNVGKLKFISYTENDVLHNNKYGISEPYFLRSKCIDIKNLNLVVVPLVAFNERCLRIGMGYGYYDRTFAYKKQSSLLKTPFLVGFAYEFQKAEFVPNEWDVPLSAVFTEQNIYLTNPFSKI